MVIHKSEKSKKWLNVPHSPLLLIVQNEDLIAKEAKYYAPCFRSLSYIPKPRQVTDSYVVFCTEVIDQRIIQGEEILKISKLVELYSNYHTQFNDLAPLDIMSNWNLKRKLKKSHPNLVYITVKDFYKIVN